MKGVMGALALSLAAAAAACDLLPAETSPAPPAAEAAPPTLPIAGLEAYRGRSFSDFVQAHGDRFSAQALGLRPADSARLQKGMERSNASLAEAAGARAMVFRGCAQAGCAEASAVAAVDEATGAIFIGVRDASGTDVLVPNERLEALLRLTSPSRDWIETSVPATAPAAASSQP